MKILSTLIIAAVTAFTVNANADSLYNDPGIGDVFPVKDIAIQQQQITIVEDTGKEVWSVEYEQWINPADLNFYGNQSVANALRELENNPPAAGKRSDEVFIWDEVADEYQLQ